MLLDMKYFDVYYFCQLANNSMGKFDYIRNHGEFVETHCDENIKDFPKESLLRAYCYWLVECVIFEQADIISQDSKNYDFNPADWICQAISKYKGISISFDDWLKSADKGEENDDYLEVFNRFVAFLNYENGKIYNIFFETVEAIAQEIEYIMFQNRDFLLRFNETIASGYEDNIRSRKYIPEWVKRAVLFRDKGCCVFCKKDLTGLYTLLEDNQKQFDHIVPLENGGINDVCNIQLSCRECNQQKATNAKTSTLYQSAY